MINTQEIRNKEILNEISPIYLSGICFEETYKAEEIYLKDLDILRRICNSSYLLYRKIITSLAEVKKKK